MRTTHFEVTSIESLRFDDVELVLPQIERERNERIERTSKWDWVDTDTPAIAKNCYRLYISIVVVLWRYGI